MPPSEPNKQKRPRVVDRPFPWQCRQCGERHVALATIDYATEVRHDGRLHSFTVSNLEIPICESCGEKVFTEQVDRQVNDALRSHLKLLTPAQIRQAVGKTGMSQKEVAKRLGIAEATLSRWLTETQIQSRSMDNLLRLFFAFPVVRNALCADGQDESLGVANLDGPFQPS